MSTIRCPKCGSYNVECTEKPHHDHACHDCGYSMLPKPKPDGPPEGDVAPQPTDAEPESAG